MGELMVSGFLWYQVRQDAIQTHLAFADFLGSQRYDDNSVQCVLSQLFTKTSLDRTT
jgi:hypothetical protein